MGDEKRIPSGKKKKEKKPQDRVCLHGPILVAGADHGELGHGGEEVKEEKGGGKKEERRGKKKKKIFSPRRK